RTVGVSRVEARQRQRRDIVAVCAYRGDDVVPRPRTEPETRDQDDRCCTHVATLTLAFSIALCAAAAAAKGPFFMDELYSDPPPRSDPHRRSRATATSPHMSSAASASSRLCSRASERQVAKESACPIVARARRRACPRSRLPAISASTARSR